MHSKEQIVNGVDAFGKLDEVKSLIADRFPAYEDLVDDMTPLTSENILARLGEHGGWFAYELDFDPLSGERDGDVHEVGIAVAWRSDGWEDGSPCIDAVLAVGSPALESSRWPVDYIEEIVTVKVPLEDEDGNLLGEDEEEAARKTAYAKLKEIVCG